MNYRLVPYSVQLADVRTLIGSEQESLATRICQQFFAAECHQHPIGVDVKSELFDAVAELVQSDYLEPERANHYGYALQAICEFLGTRLKTNNWNEVKWATLEDTGLNAVMGKGSPVPLPLIPDFPTISHLTNKKIRQQIEQPTGNSLKIESKETQCLLEDFDRWVQQAYEAKQDLVFFYY